VELCYFASFSNWYELKISLDKKVNILHDAHQITVSPIKFELESPLKKVHNDWFINLSNMKISQEVVSLLQFGKKFEMPISEQNKDETILEFIKCIEKNYIELSWTKY